MAPIFCFVYFLAGDYAHVWAGGIYMLATFTDFLDGYIARKFDLITRLGRILDPLADKLMIFTVLVSLMIKGLIPWWAASVYFVKEVLMGFGVLFFYKKANDVLPSNLLGKFAAVFFYLVCLAIMLIPQMSQNLTMVLISVALIFAFAAFLVYFLKFLRLTQSKRNLNSIPPDREM